MSVLQIQEVISKFGFAAKFCQKVGFDGVQIHAAHGYLISQFLSPKANQRKDEWGGSLENRARFLMEVIKKIKSEIDPSKKFIIGLKINSADFQEGGFTQEESSQLIQMIDKSNDLDFVELSGGNYENPVMYKGPGIRESTVQREGYFLEFSVKLRQLLKNTPLMVTGGFRSLEGMSSAVKQGIDIVGVARPFCIEPDFPNQFFAGKRTKTPDYNFPPEQNSIWHQYQMRLLANNQAPDLSFQYSKLQLLHR